MWSVYLVLAVYYLRADTVFCQSSVSGNVTVNTNQTEQMKNETLQHRLEPGEFKPSPPLETYYERNAFPVVPAQPEPKNFERSPWKTPNWSHRDTTVSFPKNSDNPYKYVTNGESRGGFAFDKKVEKPMQKTFYDYNIMEKPPAYGEEEVYHPSGYGPHYDLAPVPPPLPPHKEYGHGGYEVGGHYKSPWKKILKFLATIIPIGLFLSALTPTVITIQNTNDSMMYRSEDPSKEFTKRISSSYKYFSKLNEDGCEDKVLCELLVSASLSKNAEEHITTLLDNFVKQEDIQSKKDDLLKVFEAVKNQDCSPIYCANIQNRKLKI